MKSRRHRAIHKAVMNQWNSEERKFIEMMDNSELFERVTGESLNSLQPYQKEFLRQLLRGGRRIPRNARYVVGIDVANGNDKGVITQGYVKDGVTTITDIEYIER